MICPSLEDPSSQWADLERAGASFTTTKVSAILAVASTLAVLFGFGLALVLPYIRVLAQRNDVTCGDQSASFNL